MRTATRIERLPGNPILAISAASRRLEALGRQVSDLSVGQPDFPTPPRVVAAAARAAAAGHTRYPPPVGIGELRVAARRVLAAEGLPYRPRQLMATAGATGALHCAFQALIDPGDRVLVAAPYYPAYRVQIGLAGGVVALVETRLEDGFRLCPAALAEAVDRHRPRLLVLNQPANPTGAVYGREELAALAEVALAADLTIVADEVYRDFVHGEPGFTSIAALGPEVRRRTLVVRSLSKSGAMTGWRVGYAAGAQELIEAMTRVQHAALIGPATPCQHAAVEALGGMDGKRAPAEGVGEGETAAMVAAFARRRDLVLGRLGALPGVRLAASRGAFFAFPDVSAVVADVDDFCRRLLAERGVAVVPGSAFGAPGCVRLSWAVADDVLAAGLDGFAAALIEEVADARVA